MRFYKNCPFALKSTLQQLQYFYLQQDLQVMSHRQKGLKPPLIYHAGHSVLRKNSDADTRFDPHFAFRTVLIVRGIDSKWCWNRFWFIMTR